MTIMSLHYGATQYLKGEQMNKYTEEQDKERYDLLFEISEMYEHYLKQGCDCLKFNGLVAEEVETLINKGYLDPNDTIGDGCETTNQECLDFLKTYEHFAVQGYIVSNERDDRRITIAGIFGTSKDEKAMEEFTNKFLYMGDGGFHCRKGFQYSSDGSWGL